MPLDPSTLVISERPSLRLQTFKPPIKVAPQSVGRYSLVSSTVCEFARSQTQIVRVVVSVSGNVSVDDVVNEPAIHRYRHFENRSLKPRQQSVSNCGSLLPAYWMRKPRCSGF